MNISIGGIIEIQTKTASSCGFEKALLYGNLYRVWDNQKPGRTVESMPLLECVHAYTLYAISLTHMHAYM